MPGGHLYQFPARHDPPALDRTQQEAPDRRETGDASPSAGIPYRVLAAVVCAGLVGSLVGLAPCFRGPPGPEHVRACDEARGDLLAYTLEVGRLIGGIIAGRVLGPML
jgi:hypothetical protein